MRLSETNNKMHFAASFFLASILLLQGSVLVFMAIGKPVGAWFWPIIDYPMYSGAHEEGDHLKAFLILEVVTEDGMVSKVTADDVGLNFWKFLYIGSGIAKSSKRSADLLVSLLPDGKNITEVRVYSSPYIITKNGKADATPKLLNILTMKPENK